MNILSTSDVAKILGVPAWRIQRLYETGALEEPKRIARRRVIVGTDLPVIIDALRSRGWLPEQCQATEPEATLDARDSDAPTEVRHV